MSGDGRPYVCNRQPRFSATRRFDVSGRVQGGVVEIEELEQQLASQGGRCDPGLRQLARYRGRLDGDVLTLMSGGQRQTLYRIHNPAPADSLVAQATPLPIGKPPRRRCPSRQARCRPWPRAARPRTSAACGSGSTTASVPGGDEKQEREEWHVSQDGAKLTGYYDRIVHQVSTDGQAYRCSMALDFQIVTRYQFRGEVSGNPRDDLRELIRGLEPERLRQRQTPVGRIRGASVAR